VVCLIAGVGIVGFWAMALVTHQVPEVAEGDRAIWFHIAAEYLLGAALVAGGLLLVLVGDQPWTRVITGAALGGMVYSTINSAGYYARQATWIVAAFASLTILGLACLVALVVT